MHDGNDDGRRRRGHLPIRYFVRLLPLSLPHATMTQSPYQAQLDLAKAAAAKAGEIIKSYHSNSGSTSVGGRSNNSATVLIKSGVDLVTEADTRVEKVVTQMIKDAFPNDVIVGEEDQAESPNGGQDEPFPAKGAIWCGKII